MIKIKELLKKLLAGLCILLFVLITVIGTWQVASRYLFNSPSAWTEEVLTYGFVWMAMLASAYVFATREHMRLTFVTDKLRAKSRKIVEIITELLIILFSLMVLVYGGIKICQLTFTQITPALQWSTGVLYSVIPISGILIIIFSIINIIEIGRNKNEDLEVEEV